MTYRPPKTREALQAECDAFNFECRIGGRVAVKIDGTDKPLITTTRSPAQIMGGHSAVVWLEGVSGSYLLSHVTPIPPEPVEGEAWAVLADNGNVIYWERDRAKVEEVAQRHGRPYGQYKPGPRIPSVLDGRTVPYLPTPRQLRAAERFMGDAELAKSIYLVMTSTDALKPDEPTARAPFAHPEHPDRPCRNEIINSGADAIPKSCPRCGHNPNCPAGVARQ